MMYEICPFLSLEKIVEIGTQKHSEFYIDLKFL